MPSERSSCAKDTSFATRPTFAWRPRHCVRTWTNTPQRPPATAWRLQAERPPNCDLTHFRRDHPIRPVSPIDSPVRRYRRPPSPKRIPVKAKAYTEPLVGIRGVAFNIYGTLLRISDGELFLRHPQDVRMEIALEKTIKEFGMWNSMTRQPGAPWKGMLVRYERALDEQRLSTTHGPGEIPEADSVQIWIKMVRLLEHKEYSYDVAQYGPLEQFSEKIAYFFPASWRGREAEEGALASLTSLFQAGMRVGLVADAQRFTPVQMLRAFRQQGTLRSLDELFDPALVTLSYREGVRKPSRSLYQHAVERYRRMGI